MPKKRLYKLFINDIIDAITKIETYIKDLDYDDFIKNNMIQDAVIRNLEIIGEATRNIPSYVKEKYPNVPWKRMVGLRNIVIYGYFGVDLENIYKIVKENIPEAKPYIMKIFDECVAD